MSSFYLVRWFNPEAGSWLDILPEGVIRADHPVFDLQHDVLSPELEQLGPAKFDLEPTDDGRVLLRYGGRHKEWNRTKMIFRGDTRLNPNNFCSARTLEWRDEGETEFTALPVMVFRVEAA